MANKECKHAYLSDGKGKFFCAYCGQEAPPLEPGEEPEIQYAGEAGPLVDTGPIKRTWLQKKLAWWRELYYANKDTYYVVRNKLSSTGRAMGPGLPEIKQVDETMYLGPTGREWHTDRRKGVVCGFKMAVLILWVVRYKARKTKEYHFVLYPAGEVAWIESIINGPAVNKSDFR